MQGLTSFMSFKISLTCVGSSSEYDERSKMAIISDTLAVCAVYRVRSSSGRDNRCSARYSGYFQKIRKVEDRLLEVVIPSYPILSGDRTGSLLTLAVTSYSLAPIPILHHPHPPDLNRATKITNYLTCHLAKDFENRPVSSQISNRPKVIGRENTFKASSLLFSLSIA